VLSFLNDYDTIGEDEYLKAFYEQTNSNQNKKHLENAKNKLLLNAYQSRRRLTIASTSNL